MWRIISTILVALLALVWFIFFRPTTLGGPATYVIVTGDSMEPTLHDGDLVVTRKRASYQPGDVVTFHVADGNVIHRIVDTTPDGFVTQGDNKASVDPWTPDADQVLGRQWLYLPRAGLPLQVLQQPMMLAIIAAAITLLIMLGSGGQAPASTELGLGERLWLFVVSYVSESKKDFRALLRKARRPVKENLEYIEYRSFKLSGEEGEPEPAPEDDSLRGEIGRFFTYHLKGFIRDVRILWRRFRQK